MANEYEKLREKVARAMAAKDSGPEGSTLFDIHWREFGEGYTSGAEAAMSTIYEALKEPTTAMESAGVEAAKLYGIDFPAMMAGVHVITRAALAASPLNGGRDE